MNIAFKHISAKSTVLHDDENAQKTFLHYCARAVNHSSDGVAAQRSNNAKLSGMAFYESQHVVKRTIHCPMYRLLAILTTKSCHWEFWIFSTLAVITQNEYGHGVGLLFGLHSLRCTDPYCSVANLEFHILKITA